jgi:hypothetical protein
MLYAIKEEKKEDERKENAMLAVQGPLCSL